MQSDSHYDTETFVQWGEPEAEADIVHTLHGAGCDNSMFNINVVIAAGREDWHMKNL